MAGPQGRGAGSFARLLRERAASSPDALAYRFVEADESAAEITYADLGTRARAVAAGLATATGGRPDPALLLFAPGLNYLAGLFGCFYAGVPAVPAFPPDPARPARTMPRLAAIVEDTGSDTVLTTSNLAPLLAEWLTTALAGRTPRLIATDLTDPADPADVGSLPEIRPARLALLQYTCSGSASRCRRWRPGTSARRSPTAPPTRWSTSSTRRWRRWATTRSCPRSGTPC
ncbi:AMP-binding protein [Streptomyces sp. NPDC059590]|uniref:AMP-binding protein n=1 Tax=Streptomyces sp. NPDC059590 TaxID=3346877 RepID=UPI0036CCE241